MKSIPFTVNGTIDDNYPEEDIANLAIRFSDDYRYRFDDTELSTNNRKYDNLSYYVFSVYTYDSYSNAPCWACFAVDVEKQYMIMQWDDRTGQFLVAAQDPDISPEEILKHFQGFIDMYSF